MRFTQQIKYNLKRALPILTIAGASMMASCDKTEDEPIIPTRDIELQFWQSYYDEIDDKVIKKHASDPSVRHIYLTVVDDGYAWTFSGKNINTLRNNMQRRINIAPHKISGRGNFMFETGVTEKSDSLWYIQHGWTINKHLQKQL